MDLENIVRRILVSVGRIECMSVYNTRVVCTVGMYE